MQTKVLNLATGQEKVYDLEPRAAVVAAYAQSIGDWNTWDYEKNYAGLVKEGKTSVACGGWAAQKPR